MKQNKANLKLNIAVQKQLEEHSFPNLSLNLHTHMALFFLSHPACILLQRQLSFADSRVAGQSIPTEDWLQSPEPPPTHNVWHWTDWRVSLQHGAADSKPHTPDMPNVRSCPRQHLAITHKPGEETLRFTGGSSGNGCIHPRYWVGHLSRDERRRRTKFQMWASYLHKSK